MQKSIPHTIAKGTFWISSSTLVVKVVSLATIFLILSRLGAAEYGTLELALSISVLFSLFMLPGLDTLIVADMGAEKGKGELSRARVLLRTFLQIQFVLSCVAATTLFFGAEFLASLYQVPSSYVQLVAATFLLSPMRAAYGILFRSQLWFVLQSLIMLLEEFTKLAFLAACFFFFALTIESVLWSILASQAFALVLLALPFVRGWKSLKGGEREGQPLDFSWIGRGVWSVLTVYVGNLGKTLRLWIIQRILGAEAVGLYAVAIGLIGHTLALTPLHTVLSPMLPQYVSNRERFVKLLNKGLKYQFLAYACIGAVGFFAFPPVMIWLFPNYASAMPLFKVMLLGLLPVAFISVLTPAYFALKLQKSFFVSMVFKTTVSLMFTYPLILFFGIWGLAYEYILTSIVYGFERMRTLRAHVPELVISPRLFFIFDQDDRMLLEKASEFASRGASLWRRSNSAID